MNEQMRKIGRDMSIKMGVTMSLCLSLIGTLTSGHFTIMGFLMSFVASTVLSLIIGFIVPMSKLSTACLNSMKMRRGTMPARLMESLISDLIYTPIMTLAMVGLAFFMARKQSGGMMQTPFLAMFIPSLIICLIAGYIIIFIIQPVFLKQTMKKYGLNLTGAPGRQSQD